MESDRVTDAIFTAMELMELRAKKLKLERAVFAFLPINPKGLGCNEHLRVVAN